MNFSFEIFEDVMKKFLSEQTTLKCADGVMLNPAEPFGGPPALQLLLDFGHISAPLLISEEENDEISAVMYFCTEGKPEKMKPVRERYEKISVSSIIKLDEEAYKAGKFKLEYRFKAKTTLDLKIGVIRLLRELGSPLFIEVASLMAFSEL